MITGRLFSIGSSALATSPENRAPSEVEGDKQPKLERELKRAMEEGIDGPPAPASMGKLGKVTANGSARRGDGDRSGYRSGDRSDRDDGESLTLTVASSLVSRLPLTVLKREPLCRLHGHGRRASRFRLAYCMSFGLCAV